MNIDSFNRAQAQKEAYLKGNAFLRVTLRSLFLLAIFALPGIVAIIGNIFLCVLACVEGNHQAFNEAVSGISIKGFMEYYIDLWEFLKSLRA